MPTPKRWHVIASAVTLLIAATPAVTASAGPTGNDRAGHGRAEWAGTWAAAVTRGNTVGLTETGLNNQSIRMTVQTSVGGPRLRVRLTPEATREFIERAKRVVNAGRPPCPLCGQPLDPAGHLCPRHNGYHR